MSSSSGLKLPPTVHISFNFNGSQIIHEISIENAAIIDINQIAPDAVSSKTSFGYAGRHDHGPLPQLHQDSATGNLISSLQEAKRECDNFLTQSMKDEGDNASNLPPAHQAEKKPRLDTKG